MTLRDVVTDAGHSPMRFSQRNGVPRRQFTRDPIRASSRVGTGWRTIATMALVNTPVDATDAQLLDAVRGWVELLAQGRYDEASSQILLRSAWSAEKIREAIEQGSNTKRQGEKMPPRVTSPAAANGPPPDHAVERNTSRREPDGTIVVGYLDFRLPLDGAWTPLAVIFELVERDSKLVFRLDDIRVV